MRQARSRIAMQVFCEIKSQDYFRNNILRPLSAVNDCRTDVPGVSEVKGNQRIPQGPSKEGNKPKPKRKKLTQEEKDQKEAEKKAEAARIRKCEVSRETTRGTDD